jgi:penicillin-binding protein 2
MRRREALAALFGARAFASASTEVTLLLDVRTRRLIAAHGEATAARFLAPPGSSVKPFVLAALLRSGKLTAAEEFPCTGKLRIAGREFNCSHPVLDAPLRAETALAYSCNCFVAHVAQRFAPGELAKELAAVGFASRTGLVGEMETAGRVSPAHSPDEIRMQALGEANISITAVELVSAYGKLAANTDAAIVSGLEGAVEFGTARAAAVRNARVAGKTGSVRISDGAHIAWFAGWMPSRAPEVAIAVMVQGRSGGADAAPIAARVLEAHQAGRL